MSSITINLSESAAYLLLSVLSAHLTASIYVSAIYTPLRLVLLNVFLSGLLGCLSVYTFNNKEINSYYEINTVYEPDNYTAPVEAETMNTETVESVEETETVNEAETVDQPPTEPPQPPTEPPQPPTEPPQPPNEPPQPPNELSNLEFNNISNLININHSINVIPNNIEG